MTSHKEQPAVDTSAAMTAEAKVIRLLLDVAIAAWAAADNAECIGDGENTRATMFEPWWTDLCNALDALDGLPDDQPGCTMEPPAKAEWALRRLRSLAAHPAEPEVSIGVGGGHGQLFVSGPYEAIKRVQAFITDAETYRALKHERTGGEPAQPEGVELETTAEENLADRLMDGAAATLRRPPEIDWRSRSLQQDDKIVRLTSDLADMRARAEKAEAALGTHQQPIGDEEVEEVRISLKTLAIASRDRAREGSRWMANLANRLDGTLLLVDRLASQLRDAQARVKGMGEALDGYDSALARREHGDVAASRVVHALRAVFSRSEGWAPTHRHVGGGLYRLLPDEFHWEPAWERPAVLYENDKGVKIGRFADIFAERFTPLSRPEGSAT